MRTRVQEARRGGREHTLRKESRSHEVPAELCAGAAAVGVFVVRRDLVQGRVDFLGAKDLAALVISMGVPVKPGRPYDVSGSDQAV